MASMVFSISIGLYASFFHFISFPFLLIESFCPDMRFLRNISKSSISDFPEAYFGSNTHFKSFTICLYANSLSPGLISLINAAIASTF